MVVRLSEKNSLFILLLDLCGGNTFFSDVVVFFRLFDLCGGKFCKNTIFFAIRLMWW